MELVDIDKVLDSLELKEEELQKEIYKIYAIPDISTKPSNISSTAVQSTIPSGDVDGVRKFVGVSQVLCSLNEYRKNITRLDLYKKNKNNEHLNFNRLEKNYDFTDIVRNGVINNNDYDELQKKDDDVEVVIDIMEDVDDPCTVDESTDENGFSSNSITTSSSSTFLSGSSPDLLSTESESSPLNIDDSQDKETGVDIESFDESNNKQTSQLDDLALGLATISLATNREDGNNISVSQTAYSNVDLSELQPIQNQENKTESSLKEEQASGMQCLTFDSTMDVISDTELDRMLNEIDAETNNTLEKKDLTVKNIETDINCCKEITNNTSHVNRSPNPINLAVSLSPKWLDTFSQATSLEFIEDRTDVALDTDKTVKGLDEQILHDINIDVERRDAHKKKQRPTSLDLLAKRVNLYSTAGETPPAALAHDENPTNSDQEEDYYKYDQKQADNKPLECTDRKTNDYTSYPCVNVDVNSSVCQSDVCVLLQSTEIENKVALIEADGTKEPPPSAELSEQAIPQSVGQLCSTMPLTINDDISSNLNKEDNDDDDNSIGKLPPIWVPDQDAPVCMQCEQKFTLLKRRHHCRACGQVLCSICCSQKFKLQFLSNLESRVCVQCFLILSKLTKEQQHRNDRQNNTTSASNIVVACSPKRTNLSPNPNNPMEYCSKIPPHRQVNEQSMSSYPTVIVPVGVLKKTCNNVAKCRKRKSVMFSDGIRPGSDLAILNHKWSDAKHARRSMKIHLNHNTSDDNLAECDNWESKKIISGNVSESIDSMYDGKDCYIPTTGEQTLPPIVVTKKSEQIYEGVTNDADLITRMQSESLKFIIQKNFFVFVKICHLKCCINKTVINFTTSGLNNVANDEIIILLELDDSYQIPKDIFVHLNEIYLEASNGNPINELGYSIPKNLHFLGSREHAGFLYIRSTFQCLNDVHVPSPPFLIGLLVHRFEMPWAKIFPLRLMLRLGAQYRYYPSPHISVRNREPVYSEIAQTIINVLADFQNYTYTIPTIKGMYIHMEDRRTVILIPRNQRNEVINAINNSSDQFLAMGANFSKKADGHLVCIQNPNQQNGDSHAYSTQAINIQGLPRKVTGANFFVVNKSLKPTCGLSGRCSIVEDGLMIQVLPSKMSEIKSLLTNMKDISIVCGSIEASNAQTEVVHIQWVDEDMETNVGVRSPIDSKKMDGISSIRMHSGFAISNNNHTIKWTEVFLIEITKGNDLLNLTNVAEKIAKNAALAFLPFLDLLVANGSVKIGLRVTLNNDNVCYQAGSQNEKLPPLYTKALDKELIPTLLEEAKFIDDTLVLELIFNLLNVHIE